MLFGISFITTTHHYPFSFYPPLSLHIEHYPRHNTRGICISGRGLEDDRLDYSFGAGELFLQLARIPITLIAGLIIDSPSETLRERFNRKRLQGGCVAPPWPKNLKGLGIDA